MRRYLIRAVIMGMAFLLVVPFGPAEAAKLYRWVDNEGVVHFGDRMPPESIKFKREELNKDIRQVKVIDKEKTAEELAAEKAVADKALKAEAEAQEKRKQHVEQQRRLREMYAKEADIVAARDTRIAELQRTIEIADQRSATLQAQLADVADRRLKLEDANQSVPESMMTTTATLEREIAESEQFIATRREELAQTKTRYDNELAQFRELTKGHQAAATP